MDEEKVNYSRYKGVHYRTLTFFRSRSMVSPGTMKAYYLPGRPLKIKNPANAGFSVARAGFEPTQSEPKSEVLPLDDRAIRLRNYKKI